MEAFENVEGSLEIKERSWEARMTQNGKKSRKLALSDTCTDFFSPFSAQFSELCSIYPRWSQNDFCWIQILIML